MRNVTLYIAVSLDGYIADSTGSVDWICGQGDTAETEDTFTSFFSKVDTVIMGRKTYNQIVTELSPNLWPYTGATTYVLTHHKEVSETESIRFKNTDACRLVEELKQEAGKDIWICGGAEVVKQLIEKNIIDTYHLAIIPVILGSGIRLFDGSPKIGLALAETKKYNGIMEVVYNRRHDITSGNIAIRNMNENDTEHVMQIWLATNVQTHDFIPETYWKSQFDNVKKIIPESEVYVCEVSDKIVGFIGLSENYIAGIFVVSDFQSHGIGKKLLDYAKRLKHELCLHVYQKNTRAVKFYQREGFVIESETINSTGEKEFLMRTI